MKKLNYITLSIVLFVSVSTFGQISDYNKGVKFIDDYGKWTKTENGEIMLCKPSPVSYMKIYKEMLSVLAFYEIQFEDTVVDKTLLSGNTQIDDYSTMNLDLSIEYASVQKMWRKGNVSIYWLCSDKSYSIGIKQANQ